MKASSLMFRLGGLLFDRAFPAYRVAYSAYKAVTDRHERQLIRDLLRPGSVAIDAGANIGVYTRLMSRLVGDDGKVFAFEPGMRNYERLTETVARLRNVVAVRAALTDVTGEVELFESDQLNVDHRTYDPGDGRGHYRVPAYRLDDYIPVGDRVDFVKIDIQGFEYHALSGMRRILCENRDLVLVAEYWPAGLARAGASAQDLLDYLCGLDFEVQFIHEGALQSDPPQLGEALTDYTSLIARR